MAAKYDHVPWKVTSTNPTTALCLLCTNVVALGGFGAEYEMNMQALWDARKQKPQLLAEWNAAYKTFVAKAASESGQRLGKRFQA